MDEIEKGSAGPPGEPAAGKPDAGDDSLDPVGPEFWIGQMLMIVGVVGGILLAARAGFSEASRFSKHEDYRQARIVLGVVRQELEGNLRELRDARENIRAGRIRGVSLGTSYLERASVQPCMSMVDPTLLSEIVKLLDYPLSRAVERMNQPQGLEESERGHLEAIFSGVLDRAEKEVLPLLAVEEATLAKAEERYREGP
jgi:hypothetical protein